MHFGSRLFCCGAFSVVDWLKGTELEHSEFRQDVQYL